MLQVCNATPTNIISQYDYTYDAAGHRVSCGKSGSAFAQNDTLSYGYNNRSELTNAVASVDSDYRYAYAFDDIGNRESSSERGTNSIYAANQLNQYTEISDSALSASPRETFTPQFDDDGNQTLVKTATGVWAVTYNGENRPVLWSNGATNITMKFDRMGRRVEYIEAVNADGATITNTHHRFVYDGYLCLQRLNAAANNAIDLIFAWDPAEQIATRPLMIEKPNVCMLHVTHDGNKNVSDLVFFNGGGGPGVAAHYEYAPFGALTVSTRNPTSTPYDFRAYNPFRFSSEYADDALGLVYYNYRHYEPVEGRWLSRDPIDEMGGLCLYAFLCNAPNESDVLGELSLGELLALSGAITRTVKKNPWLKRAGLAGILLSCADCLLNIYNAAQGTPKCVKTERDQGSAVTKCVDAYKNMVGSCLTAALAGVGSAFGPWWGFGGAAAGTVISHLFDKYMPESAFKGFCPDPKVDKCCDEK